MTIRYFTIALFLFISQIGFSQSTQIHSAVITIMSKSSPSAKMKFERIKGQEAISFDLAKYLKQHGNSETLDIRGQFVKNNEVIHLAFNKKDWDGYSYQFCENITTSEKSPLLGVATLPVENKGIEVQRTIAGSAAENGGIIAGDRITHVEGETIFTACDLTNAVTAYEEGDEVVVEVQRQGKTISLPVTLGFKTIKKGTWNACEIPTNPYLSTDYTSLSLGTLSVYPNPSAGITQIKYASDIKGAWSMQLTDVTGKVLLQSDKNYEFDGYYEKEIDLSPYASGIYFLRVNHEGELRTEKIIVAKDL